MQILPWWKPSKKHHFTGGWTYWSFWKMWWKSICDFWTLSSFGRYRNAEKAYWTGKLWSNLTMWLFGHSYKLTIILYLIYESFSVAGHFCGNKICWGWVMEWNWLTLQIFSKRSLQQGFSVWVFTWLGGLHASILCQKWYGTLPISSKIYH